MKITKQSNIMEIVQKHPETMKVFEKYGLHCIGCMAAQFETLEVGAKAHSIDIDKLVEDLNKAVKK